MPYTAEIIEGDDGEMILTFPEELLDELGWQEGDTLRWRIGDDGTITLDKVVQTDSSE